MKIFNLIDRESKLYNALWYIFGTTFFGFTSLIYTIITTRVLGIETGGKFAFAFAVACTFYIVGVYFGRTFQLTDITGKYSDTDYIYNKLTTCIAMIIITLLFCLIKNYDLNKLLLILVLTLYRGIDAFLDSIHSVIQKKDKISIIGKLFFYRTLFLIIAFLITTIISQNILISCIVILIIDILFVIIFDFRIASKKLSISKYDSNKNFSLLREGITVFIFSFLSMYVLNSSKYAIDTFTNDNIQGIFSILILPASFLSVISSIIIQPFVNDIADNLEKKDYKKLINLTIKLIKLIITGGLFVLLVGYILGIPVLNLLYGINLNKYKILLMIILIGSILYSIYILLSTIFIAMRKNIIQDILLFITSGFALILCNNFVKNNGINGACYAYLYIMLFQLVLYIGAFSYYMIKERKK